MAKSEEETQVQVQVREDKVAPEVAEQEFMRFVDGMGIDISDPNAEEQETINAYKRKIVGAIQRGTLTIDAECQPVFTPVRSEDKTPLTFFEPTGSVILQMDRKKVGQDIGKLFAVMASMTKTHPTRFNSMKYSDVQVCTAVTTLFLAG